MRNADCRASLNRRTLLDGVHKLVCDQFISFPAFGPELIPTEKNLIADREGLGVQLGAETRGLLVGVNPYTTEPRVEPGLHEMLYT